MLNKKVAIIGGDLRQEYMADLLENQGVKVITYGLSKQLHRNNLEEAGSMKEALREAELILAPIPLSRDGERIHAISPKNDLMVDRFIESLQENQTLYAGGITEAIQKRCREKKVMVVDFMKIEEITIFNAIATAEGAISEAILQYPSNLHNSECLLLGFGRCAKILAHKLRGLSAKVCVCARSGTARAEAMAYGYRACSFEGMKTGENGLSQFDLIFNTVPVMVLGEEELEDVRKDAVIIDIASSPGGLNYEAAELMGINAKLCLGLPGKYSPKSSAEELLKWIT